VLFRGGAEAAIRRNLIRRGLIKGIIGLPANLFYGTSIPACIIVIDKEHAQARTGIFMLDASKGYMKDGNKNRLRSQDLHKIVDVFTRQLELPRYARMVSLKEIETNDFNLNIPRYIDSSEPEDLHDLNAHLNGGIPNRDIDALDNYWQVFPTLRPVLFKANGRKGYSDACIAAPEVKATILNRPEFAEYSKRVLAIYNDWRAAHLPRLKGLKIGTDPKALIHTLSEDLLDRFVTAQLVDNYDVYQHLMDYWAEVMQDDVYAIAQDGWQEAAKIRTIVEDKDKKTKEAPDLVINKKKYKADLIPPALIVARYFAKEQAAIDALQAATDALAQELEAYVEEHSGEEGLLEDAKTEKGKVTKVSVKSRLAEIKTIPDSDDERKVLERCQELLEQESEADKKIKDAQKALDEKVFAQYAKLKEADIKQLAVEDKWLAAIAAQVTAEVERVTQSLAARIKTLEERYAESLPKLTDEVTALSLRVDEHLKRMGLKWSSCT
jgi:type I restriction enzyme M protein